MHDSERYSSTFVPNPSDIDTLEHEHRVAVLIPCYNEEYTIGKVVQDFHRSLPRATIYVFDNNSSDSTRKVAQEAGAVLRTESLQGKGNVVRRMFSDIEADIYVMVDGDGTYDASAAPRMIQRLIDGPLDMVNARRTTNAAEAYRFGHRFGNILLTKIVAYIFGKRFQDMLSGYRVFSRRFVKSFPALTAGFEIETELTVHALELRMPVDELDTVYLARASGSSSKLNTYRDGFKILRTIIMLVKEERPFQFFAFQALGLALLSIIFIWPVIITYLETGLVPRFPTAVLSTGIMLLAFLSLTAGIILDTVTHGRQELKRLRYLEIPVIAGKSALDKFLPPRNGRLKL